MTNRIRREFVGACLSVAVASAAFVSAAHGQSWKPDKPIELIVQSAPGGGTDVTARLIQRIIQDNKLTDVPVSVVNKPGGSGNVALSYLKQHAGDGHYLQVASAGVITGYITGNSDFNYTDFSPITQLNAEYIAFGVNAESSIKTGKDLIDALAKDPASLSIAIGTALGGTNHIVTANIAQAAKVDPKKIKAVVFKSSNESATALLGNHVDVAASSASVLMPYVPEKIRLIGISSPHRLSGALANVPTWAEQGVATDVNNFRMLLGAPNLTPAQVQYWKDLMAKVMETADWKKDLEANGWNSEKTMNAAEFRTYVDAQFKEMSATLNSIGMAANGR